MTDYDEFKEEVIRTAVVLEEKVFESILRDNPLPLDIELEIRRRRKETYKKYAKRKLDI